MTKAERIKSVLVEFAGYGLTAREIAAEAEASLSWTYRVLRRLEAEGFLIFDHHAPSGVKVRARVYRAFRGQVEAYAEELEAEMLEEAEALADAWDHEAEYQAWARRAS